MDYKIFISDLEYGPEEEKAVLETVKSRWLTMGPRTEKFESAFAREQGGKFCLLVSNGTSALHLSMAALGLESGDEAILPSLTFAASANTAVQCGAKCVFADIQDVTVPLISPEDVQKKITPRTRIIMAVHYAGFSADTASLRDIIDRENDRRSKAGEQRPLFLIEDAAHAAGAKNAEGKFLGTLGECGCFSLFSNKNIAAGEGGILLTGDQQLFDRMKLLRSHGLTRQTWERHKHGASQAPYLYDLREPGYNYRPSEITAALAGCQLNKLQSINQKRRDIFHYVHHELSDNDKIVLPFQNPESWGTPSYHILPVLLDSVKERIRIAAELAEAGIQTSNHYRPVHTMSYYQNIAEREWTLPRTEEYAEREMTLPLHTRLTDAEVEYVIKTLKKAVT